MKLELLLKKITPLQAKCGTILDSKGLELSREELRAVAAAANVLPELVEAVRSFNETRADVAWNCKAMWDAADNLKTTLARAEEVEFDP